MEISPKGSFFVVAYQGGVVEIIEAKSQKSISNFSLQKDENINIEHICFSSDEKYLAFSYPQKVVILDSSARLIRQFTLSNYQGNIFLRFFDNKLYFFDNSQITVYNFLLNEIADIQKDFVGALSKVAISPSGKYLAYKSEESQRSLLSTFYILNTDDFSLVKSFELAYDYFGGGHSYKAAFDFDKNNEDRLHIVHKSQGLLSWDWKNDKLLEHTAWEELEIEGIYSPKIDSCRFQPEGSIVAFRSYQHRSLRQEENRQASFFDFNKHEFLGNLPAEGWFAIDNENFYFVKESEKNDNLSLSYLALQKYLNLP